MLLLPSPDAMCMPRALGASSGSLVPISGSPTLPRPFPSPRSLPPFATASASENSSAAGFVSSTRPRLTSPSHQAKPSFLRGLHCMVDCWITHDNAIPSASLHVRGEGPSPSSSVFLGFPRIPPLSTSRRFSRSRRFCDPAISSGFPHYFSGSRPLSEFQGFPPNFWGCTHFWGLADFSRSGCPSRSGSLPRSGCHPRSIRRLRFFPHLTTSLSVTRPRHLPSVCLSPDFGQSVTWPWSVRQPASVCPSPNFVLSVTRLRSVRHLTLVCPSPGLGLFVAQPRSVRHPTCDCRVSRMSRCSRRLCHMDPDNSLDTPAPPPSAREAGASSPAPPSAAGTVVPALSPVVLRVLPLRGSLAPIGFIYDATPDADGGLLAAASAFFSFTGHQIFHDPCPDLAAYRQSRGVALSVVPVNCLLDHIFSSGLELLDGLFAPSPTNSGAAFMSVYLAPPPLAPPQLPSGDRSVASGLGSGRGVDSVVGGNGVHGQSSAPPLGGLGTPGGPSATFVGLPGRWPDPDDGVTALSQFHPFLGVPPSLGDVGVHPRVSVSDVGGLGVPSTWVQSPSVMGRGAPVALEGHPSCMKGMLVAGRTQTKGSQTLFIPTMLWVLVPWPLQAPFAALPSPLWWRFPLLSHPVVAPPFHPRYHFRVVPRIIWVHGHLLAVIMGGAPLLCLPAHQVALLAGRCHRFTPFLPLSIIGVRRVWSGMSPIGRSLHRMTFPFLRSRFRWTNLLCRPSSRARTI